MSRTRDEVRYAAQQTKILQEAARIFREKGYAGTTMDDVAAALGQTKAAVYYYYGSKEDILLEICERAVDVALERLEEIVAAEGPPAMEKVGQVVETHMATMSANLDAFSVFFREAELTNSDRSRRIRSKQRDFSKRLEALIEEGIESGEFRVVDVRLTTLAILGMCNWSYRWLPRSDQAVKEVGNSFADFVQQALAAR